MLGYAANAILHWPALRLQERFAARCAESGAIADDTLRDHLGPDLDPQAFWSKVKANLEAGRVRLLFVADRIPPELRKVVEFLNRQMQPAQVLAVELPRHGKSILSSVALPAWILGRDPTRKIICASYGEHLSKDFSLRTRELLQSAEYQSIFPGVELADGGAALPELRLTQKGYRLATTVNGVATGKGAHFAIVDDPLKAIDAGSKTRNRPPNDFELLRKPGGPAREKADARLASPLPLRLSDTLLTHDAPLRGVLLEGGPQDIFCDSVQFPDPTRREFVALLPNSL
jgi:hypothetical protein